MSDPCQVDFYLLSTPGLDARRMACRLALMSWERGNRTTVVTDSLAAARKLDDLMWESPADRFLPHEVDDENSAGSAPVMITPVERLSDDGLVASDVVINLCVKPLPELTRIKRLLEIVPGEKEAREASRDKFRHYRGLGISPATHEIKK